MACAAVKGKPVTRAETSTEDWSPLFPVTPTLVATDASKLAALLRLASLRRPAAYARMLMRLI